MEAYYLALAAFGALMAYLTFREYRRRRIKLSSLILWEMLWVSITVFCLCPSLITIAIEALNVALPVHLFSVASILVLFVLVYRLYAKLEELNENLIRLAREVTLRQLDEEQKARAGVS